MFRLLYHPAVATDDVPRIPRNLRSRIARAIQQQSEEQAPLFGLMRKVLKAMKV